MGRTLALIWQARGRREKTVPLDEIEECIVGAGSDVFRRNWISDQVGAPTRLALSWEPLPSPFRRKLDLRP
eukprot:819649-Prymnesium_polylepis.1